MLLSEIEQIQDNLSYAALDESVVSYRASNDGIFTKSHVYIKDLHSSNDKENQELFKLWKYFDLESTKTLVEFGNPPPGLLYADSNTIIFERPPTMKLVSWTNYLLDEISDNSKYHTFEIPIPWQVYFVHFTPSEDGANIISNIFMAFSNTQVHSEDQVLYQPPLSNFYTTGQLCSPNYETYAEISDGTETISGIMQNAYNQVWDSKSNNDLTQCFVAFQRHFATPICVPCDNGKIKFQVRENQKHLFDNTVAKNIKTHNYMGCFHDSYYTPKEYPYYFYDSWSQIPISEVCSLEWAPLDLEENDNYYHSKIICRISDSSFIKYIKDATDHDIASNIFKEDNCCDNCSGYNEDCDDYFCLEEDCKCHAFLFDLDLNFWINPETNNTFFYEYFNEKGVLPKPFATVTDVYNSLIRKVSRLSGFPTTRTARRLSSPRMIVSSELSRLASLPS